MALAGVQFARADGERPPYAYRQREHQLGKAIVAQRVKQFALAYHLVPMGWGKQDAAAKLLCRSSAGLLLGLPTYVVGAWENERLILPIRLM